ncbi:MAG TPA: DUF3108 domain-containing protein [Candidatus Krumholzibacteria bacterium]|nr:DUF3108 domain-containing protein [Candidatus Krumholzibacteria bacterium]
MTLGARSTRTGNGWIGACLLVAIVWGPAMASASGDAPADSLPPAPSDDLPVSLDELPYDLGEVSTFEIGYGPIKAGRATITVEDTLTYFGQKVVHVRTRARSNRFFDAFFKVRDQANSYIDADSLFARYYSKTLREGGYERDVEIHFDQIDGIAYYPSGKESKFPAPIHDVLSAFFRVRTLPLPPGASFRLPTHGDDEIYDLRIDVVRREVRDTPLGRVRCVVVRPTLGDEGLFRHEGDLLVWFTDDERRVPVLMRATVPVGAIEARLTDYDPGGRR